MSLSDEELVNVTLVQKRNLLRLYDHAYYVLNKPLVPDAVYDQIFQEVKDIETKYPDLIDQWSPTQRLSHNRAEAFQKAQHLEPMLSIKTVLHDEDKPVEKFIASIGGKLAGKKTASPPWRSEMLCCELKYDGLAINAHYHQGRLVQAATRGDGNIGEDVTLNFMTIRSVPLLLMKSSIPEEIEIRGEVMMSHEAFERINAELIAKGEKPYANPRNAAAGSLRQLDPNITAQRDLIFVPYSLGAITSNGVKKHPLTQYELLKQFEAWGFITSLEFVKTTDEESEVYRFYKDVESKRSQLGFDIDGIVIKVNKLRFQKDLGITGREPNWAIAYKFPPEEAMTKALKIRLQVGRLGAITPVLEVEPVRVGGVEVTNINLHNQDEIDRHDVRIGDMVIIRRAGDVVPELVRVLHEMRQEDLPKYRIEDNINGCPVCGSEVVREESKADYICTGGLDCAAQKSQIIEHFASRKAMRIEGLGAVLAEELAPHIRYLDEIFHLLPEDLKAITTLGPKQIEKLSAELRKERVLDAWRVIYSLSIPGVGEETAKDLARHFPGIKEMIDHDFHQGDKIAGIGPKTIANLHMYLQKNAAVIESILNHVKLKQATTGDKLKGLNFVITGSFGELKRDDIAKLIEENGGKLQSSVGKKTNYVIGGESPGSKIDDAGKLNIPVISLTDLKTLIGKLYG